MSNKCLMTVITIFPKRLSGMAKTDGALTGAPIACGKAWAQVGVVESLANASISTVNATDGKTMKNYL